MYVYGNMIYSALAIIIALGAFFGYKISKVKMDKKAPVVIAIVSIISVTIATFVIIPMLLLAKDGHQMSLENIQFLYEYDEFRTAILGDYIISLLFTILGISGIIINLHKQIKSGVDEKDIKILKNNDNSAENEISENVVNSEVEAKKQKSSEVKKVILILAVMAIVIGVAIAFNSDSNTKTETISSVEITDTDMKLDFPKELELLTDEEIDAAYGTGASGYYEFIAMNFTGTKSIIGYIFDKTGLEEDISAEEYLKVIFSDLENIEVKEKDISGYSFSYVESDYTYEGEDYTEEYLVHELDNKFICLYVVYPKGEAIDLDEIISKNE